MDKKKILIAEDELLIARDLKNNLERMGYTVTSMSVSGEGAVKHAKDENPDLVLMDIMLKGKLDGIDAAEKIHTQYNIPIIYLTAFADEKTLQRAKVTEPYAYILKPFDSRELHSSIEMALYKHKTGQKLKEREEWLSTTLNSIGDAVISTDKKGFITYMNPVAENLTAWNIKEAEGKNLTDVFNIVNVITKKKVDNPVSKVIVSGKIVGLANHTMLISKDGKEYQIADSGAPIKDTNGNICGVVLVFRDVTREYQMQESLRENENNLRALFNAMTDIVFEIGYDGRYINIAPTSPGLMLQPSKDLVGKTVHEVFPKTEADMFLKYIRECLDGNEIATIEYPLIVENKTIWFEGRATPKTKNSVLYIARDITERKKAETALIQSKEKYRKIFEHAPIGIITIDKEGNPITMNQYVLDILGSPSVEATKQINVIKFKNLKDIGFSDDFIKCVNSGKVIRNEKNYTSKWDKKRYIRYILTPIVDNKNLIQGVQAIYEDITERKQVEGKMKELNENLASQNEEFQVLNEELKENMERIREINAELEKAKEHAEESDRLKSAFLANMSHEIRTPMNGILGFASLLKEPELSGEKQQKYLGIIENSGQRMLSIINDLIDISKLEAGQVETVISKVDINKHMKYLYTFFKPEAAKKGISLSYKNSLPDSEAIILTDQEKFFAICTNLLKNAIKYTHDGSIGFGYTLSTDRKPAELDFYVKDTGIGISPDKLQMIFECFVQADQSLTRNYEGAGLGLSISKAFVEMLGGKIWLESEEGVGSQFYFTIPYSVENKKTTGKKAGYEKALGHQFKKLKILIAEDEETADLLLSIMLKDIGKEFLHTKTGYGAVEMCRDNPGIDLVLMDIKMSQMDGYEATKQIRKFNKDVIIIAQTAYALAYDREKAISAGCNNYIAKPIKKDELIEMITGLFKDSYKPGCTP